MLEVTVLTGPLACGYCPLHTPSYGQVKGHSHHQRMFLIRKLLFLPPLPTMLPATHPALGMAKAVSSPGWP